MDLISDRLDIDLTKDEGGSNWSAQKLTFSQLQYAADDVGFLYDLKDRLTKEIKDAEMNDIFDLEMLVLPISAQLHLTGIAVDRTEVQEMSLHYGYSALLPIGFASQPTLTVALYLNRNYCT